MITRRRRIVMVAAAGAAAGGIYRLLRARRALRKTPGASLPLSDPALLIAPLARFGAADIAIAGGKGAHLGELVRAGFPVPPGFVITAAAYQRFVEDAGLHAHIDAAVAGVDHEDLQAIEHASATICSAFLAAPVPPEVADLVRASMATLRGAVAVRSSATVEDLPGASAAGQLETLLNISGEAAVLDALRSCWASLWTPRAIAYRVHQGLDHRDARVAVVVQQMAPAESAGVVFTVDPVSGARDRLVINAAPGLGDELVGGRITPDHLVVSRRGLRIVEQRLARVGRPALPNNAVNELARLALAVERHFGAPQDIEWAWAAGNVAVLQARPITALKDQAAHDSRARNALAEIADRIPMRPYPIDTYFMGTFSRALFDALFGSFGLSATPIDEMCVEEDGVVTEIHPAGPRVTPRVIYKPWLSLWRSRRYDLARLAEDPVLSEAQLRARELAARDVTTLSWEALLRMVYEADAIVPLTTDLRRRYFPRLVPAFLRYHVLMRLAGQTRHDGMLMSGVPNTTLAISDALEVLAERIRDDPPVRRLFMETDVDNLLDALRAEPAAETFLEAFAEFLRRYGQREYVIMPSQGSWRNRPAIPLALLKSMATSERRSAQGGPAAWEQARDVVLAESFLGWPGVRGLYLRTLDQARFFSQIRENTHFHLTLHLPVLHDVLMEIGRRLVEVGALDTRDDVVHLTFREIEAAPAWPPDSATVAKWRATVERRKAKRATLGPWRPGTLLPLPVTLDRTALLAGIPASPGTGSGPVCVVASPAEFGKVRPGDVLVARYTDPAWTPLFTRVVAVIADSGGMGSHAAIVAREYGVPAVLGTGDATLRLQDGQHVLVDGNRGLVLPVTEPAPAVPT